MKAGRVEAAAVVWDWQGKATRSASSAGGSAARARRKGLVQAAVSALLGATLFAFWSQAIGTVVLTIASIVGLSALVSPLGLYAAIERLLLWLGHATGRLLTWLLLAPVFYGFFVPFGLLLRRGRRDRLKRRLDPDAPSYWEAHAGLTAASSSYEKQY